MPSVVPPTKDTGSVTIILCRVRTGHEANGGADWGPLSQRDLRVLLHHRVAALPGSGPARPGAARRCVADNGIARAVAAVAHRTISPLKPINAFDERLHCHIVLPVCFGRHWLPIDSIDSTDSY